MNVPFHFLMAVLKVPSNCVAAISQERKMMDV